MAILRHSFGLLLVVSVGAGAARENEEGQVELVEEAGERRETYTEEEPVRNRALVAV